MSHRGFLLPMNLPKVIDRAANKPLPSTKHKIVSRFAGMCRVCRLPYAIGETIYWGMNRGSVHLHCLPVGRLRDIAAAAKRLAAKRAP